MAETYTCAECGRTFDKVRSDEEAMAESVEIWGQIEADDLAVICNDCFQTMMAPGTPASEQALRNEQAKAWRKARADNPKLARLLWRRMREAERKLVEAFINAPRSDSRFGLQALIAEMPDALR